MRVSTDKQGVQYLLNDDGSLYIKLPGEKRIRSIGRRYKEAGKYIWEKFEKEEDIYRKLNAWSIPEYLLSKVDIIKFITRENIYTLTTQDILKLGEWKHYKKSGYEKKIYVPLDYWQIKKQNYVHNERGPVESPSTTSH